MMPGFLLHRGAVVNCMHGGVVTPIVTSTRVFVSGMTVTMQPFPWAIAGCPLLSPCVTAIWITAATRVLADAMPVLLFDSQATCPAPGSGVVVSMTQTRTAGT